MTSRNHPTALFDAVCNGAATDPDKAALADLLRGDDAMTVAFIRHMDLHAALIRAAAQNAQRVTSNAAFPSPFKRALRPAKVRGSKLRFAFANARFAAAAAAILLVACGVAIYLGVFNRQSAIDNRQSPSAPIATIIETTGNLIVGDTIAGPGAEIAAGDISLDTGSADFRLTNGVEVTLRSESRLTVHSPMSATLTRGSATFDCPPAAKGYTVHLPGGAKVVDLGTAFTVFVDGESRVVLVNKGEVELRPAAGPALSLFAGQLAGSSEAGVWLSVESFEAAIDRPWLTAAAIAALRRQSIAADPSVVLYEPFDDGQATGRSEIERAGRFTSFDDRRPPIASDGEFERLTLAAWVKLDPSNATSRVLLIDRVWHEQSHFGWEVRGDKLCLAVFENGSPPGYFSPSVLDASHLGRWVHVAVVYDSRRAVVEFYVDGRRVSQEVMAHPLPLRTDAVHVGVWTDQDPRPLMGEIDDLMMIDSALSAEQIYTMWKIGSAKAAAPAPQTRTGEQP